VLGIFLELYSGKRYILVMSRNLHICLEMLHVFQVIDQNHLLCALSLLDLCQCSLYPFPCNLLAHTFLALFTCSFSTSFSSPFSILSRNHASSFRASVRLTPITHPTPFAVIPLKMSGVAGIISGSLAIAPYVTITAFRPSSFIIFDVVFPPTQLRAMRISWFHGKR
jgi:hypothetical protein